MRKSCVQTVSWVRDVGAQSGGLYTRLLGQVLGAVQKPGGLYQSVPVVLPAVFHGPNRVFTPVLAAVMPTIHTTNKSSDKVYLKYFTNS